MGVISITWMAVIAVLVLAQKLLPVKAAVDIPLALMIVGAGNLDGPRALVGSQSPGRRCETFLVVRASPNSVKPQGRNHDR